MSGLLVHHETFSVTFKGQGRKSKIKPHRRKTRAQQLLEWPTVTAKQTYTGNCK